MSRIDADLMEDSGAFMSREDTENTIAYFMAWEARRGMAPSSFTTYCVNIAGDFADRRIFNHFQAALNGRWIKRHFSGFERGHSEEHPESERLKHAFVPNFFNNARQVLDRVRGRHPDQPLLSREDDTARRAEILALRIGVWFTLRKAEYLPCRTAKGWQHGLPLTDITITNAEGYVMSLSQITSVHDVQALAFNIRRSKTDQFGHGRIRTFQRQTNPTKSCIVRDVVEWLMHLRDEYNAGDDNAEFDDHLFSTQGYDWITAADVNTIIKDIVVGNGMNPARYTPHSLRHGGATILAMAGMERYIIEHHGGWAPGSKSLAIYLDSFIATDQLATVGNIMSLAECGTLDLVRHINSIRKA